jgi:very-short-patch-repair endonuclease
MTTTHLFTEGKTTARLNSCSFSSHTLERSKPDYKNQSVQYSSFLPIVVGVIVLLLFVLLAKKLASGKREPDEWQFYAKKPLTAPEQVLYWRLIKALPQHVVLAQVQCSRVLGVKRGFNFNEWNNRINRLSYDFVVCRKDGSVVAAIELDDKSHESATRAEQDARKQRATEAAGLRLVRWNVAKMPDEAVIRGWRDTPLSTSGRVAWGARSAQSAVICLRLMGEGSCILETQAPRAEMVDAHASCKIRSFDSLLCKVPVSATE